MLNNSLDNKLSVLNENKTFNLSSDYTVSGLIFRHSSDYSMFQATFSGNFPTNVMTKIGQMNIGYNATEQICIVAIDNTNDKPIRCFITINGEIYIKCVWGATTSITIPITFFKA